MPTPFYHLSLAEDLLRYPGLPGKVKQFLNASRCAFLFGNTAADVQVVSGQKRLQTHFFDLPIQDDAPLAWEQLLRVNPELADAEKLPAKQAAFLAGYLCHLQADWIWVKEIFAPTFGPRCTWGSFRDRLYLHNVLRAYLDVRILPQLHMGMATCLQRVLPEHWLPFVEDRYLVEWRNFLFPQLQPGAATQTVELFSNRGGIAAVEFNALLESERRMQEEVFVHLPLDQITHYHQHVIDENSRLLSNYLEFALHPVLHPGKPNPYEGVSP